MFDFIEKTSDVFPHDDDGNPIFFIGTTKAGADDAAPAKPLSGGAQPKGAVISNACVSSAQAVIEAMDALNDHDADVACVQGFDWLTGFIKDGFSSLQALSDSPARPFDKDRDGLSLGEAGVVAKLVRAADAPECPQILGYGCSNDANHISGPAKDGSGLALAIERALVGIDTSRVAAICAHGTGTIYNDAMEARAFRRVFKESCPPVFGIKGSLGHTLGAAGLLEVIISAKVAETGSIPAIVGLNASDTDLPLVCGFPAKVDCGLVLTTNSGFGGMNTAIVVGPGTGRA
jgi:3-oxoacyl-[acyl-carrier-protein] synthase II